MQLYLLVFFPMFAAAAAWLLRGKPRLRDGFVLAVAALELAVSLMLLKTPGVQVQWNGFAGLGIYLAAGSFPTILSILASLLWLGTILVSPEYFAGGARTGRYYVFLLWTLGAIQGVFLGGDLFTIFIFFEIMSFTSYVWVVQTERPEALRAGETYLYVAVIGGLAMLMGLFLLYRACGSLVPAEILEAADDIPWAVRLGSGLCLLTGFGAKAGMFPLHIWLPQAHPVAPAPASALLSGILTKSGVFGAMLVTCHLFAGQASWGNLLLALATVTMVLGAVLAVFSTNLKRTLACSSMSQIGFILVGLAMLQLLGGEDGGLAAYGTVLHMLNHSLIKLTLFVAAGVVYTRCHALDFASIRGFGRGKPWLLVCFLSGACSIAGIPGFGGYISKTQLHESIVEYIAHLAELGLPTGAYTAVEWLFLISGGLTFAYMFRLFWILFLSPPAVEGESHGGSGRYMSRPTAAVLAAAAVVMPLLGLTAHQSMEKLADYALPFLRAHGPHHAVHYFAWVNLKGACISIAIGLAVLFLVGRLWLTRRGPEGEQYRDVWPRRLDLETLVYRPVLSGLAFVGTVIARLAASVGEWVLYGILGLIHYRAKDKLHLPEDHHFGAGGKPRRRFIVGEAFSFDLALTGIGLTAMLLYLLLR